MFVPYHSPQAVQLRGQIDAVLAYFAGKLAWTRPDLARTLHLHAQICVVRGVPDGQIMDGIDRRVVPTATAFPMRLTEYECNRVVLECAQAIIACRNACDPNKK